MALQQQLSTSAAVDDVTGGSNNKHMDTQWRLRSKALSMPFSP